MAPPPSSPSQRPLLTSSLSQPQLMPYSASRSNAAAIDVASMLAADDDYAPPSTTQTSFNAPPPMSTTTTTLPPPPVLHAQPSFSTPNVSLLSNPSMRSLPITPPSQPSSSFAAADDGAALPTFACQICGKRFVLAHVYETQNRFFF